MVTGAEEDPKKKPQPQLVKLNHAFKLAEQWVNNMSKSSSNDKSTSIDLEGRPMRLGIGATVPKESQFTRSSNPVERKLLAKLHNDKRKVAMKDEALVPSAENGKADEEDSDEEESESKTRAFTKKRTPNSISHLHARKKRR
ncbi:uncharacterized protein LOC131004750 [Salvia miltiorrhiza]|uniref:uncharacterized protein LOC131004750 n=1 Tax=Salvia miltiorrhiza TaxID=226208 RepID=UPI0025AC4D99|nr:uncharacterized protein LOC131004750 [Salvia miltiorrhiza]XP_057787482.1 uncharacterized protein LOC131004750 [Salvia miltiorrhiza]